MEETSGLQCFWGEIKKHPHCPHGPTLLFGRQINDDDMEKFYACSACRDRKLCKFYLKYEATLTKQQKAMWDVERKKAVAAYNHQKLYVRFTELLANSSTYRNYCHTCERLFFSTEKLKHKDHEVVENLTDYQMRNPTEILRPLDNSKKEAQYLFSKKAVKEIVNMLCKLGVKQVLCIGTPRIHEYINQHCEETMSSLLLDFDGRFHNFFGPLNYCWYNLFNHHFFREEAAEVFKDFMTSNDGKDTFIVCDPPFGGRVEPMSQTIKTISDLHKKWNNLQEPENELKTLFIFPYYMEHVMKEKSNPPGISGGLKELKMSDYKVDYENHPLFITGDKGKKQSSVVRIFTNVPLNLLELPESEYKYCKRCKKWTSMENKHCKKCKACTSKDGRRYKHCNICERCVKQSWKHCSTCERCLLEKHKCGQKPRITGCCFKCNKFGHTEKDCNQNPGDKSLLSNKNRKKRRLEKNDTQEESSESSVRKKIKTDNGTKSKAKREIPLSKTEETPTLPEVMVPKRVKNKGKNKKTKKYINGFNEHSNKDLTLQTTNPSEKTSAQKKKKQKLSKTSGSEKSCENTSAINEDNANNIKSKTIDSVSRSDSFNVHKSIKKHKVPDVSKINKNKELQILSLQRKKKLGKHVPKVRKNCGNIS